MTPNAEKELTPTTRFASLFAACFVVAAVAMPVLAQASRIVA